MLKKSHKMILLVLGLAITLSSACRQAENPSSSTPVKPEVAQNQANPATKDDAQTEVAPPKPLPTTFRAGIVVPVGTIGYRVESAEFADKLPDGTKPAAGRKFLLLKIGARNTGAKESALATFKVIGGSTEYLLSTNADKVPGSLNKLKQLGKDELKSGVLIFETPPTKGLKLQLNSAPPIKDEMFIELAEAFGKK